MKRILTMFLCFLLCGQATTAVSAGPGLTLGIVPIHSARVLVDRYEPLRAYLEKVSKQPVRIETAPDFAKFQARTVKGDFDITITPAHLARLAQKDAGFVPLVQFYPDHDALLIYSADRPINLPKGMQGGKLAVIDGLAVTVMAVLSHLEQNGVEAGDDYKVETYHTHASVAHALMSGLASAAVTTSQGLLQIPEDLRRKIVVYRHVADIPAFVFLAKPDLPADQASLYREALLKFGGAEEGLEFFGRVGYTGLKVANEAAMKRADVYLKQTRKILKP